MKRRISLLPVVLLSVGLAVMAGCGNKDQNTAAAGSAPTTEQQIAEIQNDPNMPPQAKQAAIQAIQQQSRQAASQGQASGAAMGEAAKSREQTTK